MYKFLLYILAVGLSVFIIFLENLSNKNDVVFYILGFSIFEGFRNIRSTGPPWIPRFSMELEVQILHGIERIRSEGRICPTRMRSSLACLQVGETGNVRAVAVLGLNREESNSFQIFLVDPRQHCSCW